MNPISVDPKTTLRAQAFELWMNAPNPMVTFFKTLDVSPLVRLSRRHKLKFNMLMCWCVGKAANEVKEFFLLPVAVFTRSGRWMSMRQTSGICGIILVKQMRGKNE